METAEGFVTISHQNIGLDEACAREPCLGSLLSNITRDTRIRTKIETQTCLDKTKLPQPTRPGMKFKPLGRSGIQCFIYPPEFVQHFFVQIFQVKTKVWASIL